MTTLSYFGLYLYLFFANIQNANALFDPALFNDLNEVENVQIIHKVSHVTRKRSITENNVPDAIHTSVKSGSHDVTLSFKKSDRHWMGPVLCANSRKAFHKPCISAYEDAVNNAHAIVDTCNGEKELQMLAELLIEDDVYIILPNKSMTSDTHAQHGFYRVQALPYTLTNDYVDPDTKDANDIPVSPKPSRFRRQGPTNTVELVFVVDPSLYQFWKSLTSGTNAEQETAADDNIQKFYTFLANGMNARYNGLTTYDLNIAVELVAVYVAKTQAEMTITENADFTGSTRGVLVGEELLANFNTWVAGQKTDNTNFPDNADHYMLLTGHDISLQGVTEAAGYAFLGKICTTESVSLIDVRFDLIAGAVAAHELGHSLGGLHDGTITGCSDANGYVLAATNIAQTIANKKRNPWIFSECSATSFKETIARLNSVNTNCMETKTATVIAPAATGAGIGQTFTPDRQCEIVVGDGSEMKRSLHHGKYGDICTGMWCTNGNILSVTLIIPADGTTCGNNKWCRNGECLLSEDAPAANEECMYGDQPGEYSANKQCAVEVGENKAACYQANIVAACCASCASAKISDVAGCEYGDAEDCSQVSSSQCYGSIIRNVQCCKTCKDYEKPNLPVDCQFGDHFTNCAQSNCEALPHDCCETCHVQPTTKPTTQSGNQTTVSGQTTKATEQTTTTQKDDVTTQSRGKGDLPEWIIPTIATVGGVVLVGLLIALFTYFCNQHRNDGRSQRRHYRSNNMRGNDREYDNRGFYDNKDRFGFDRINTY